MCAWCPLRYQVMGLLAHSQPSAVALGVFEEIGNVHQSLTDVVPKALGILWEPEFRPSSERAHTLGSAHPFLSLLRPQWAITHCL